MSNEEKPKKKRVLFLSLLIVCAFVGLIGFSVYQNAVDKEYEQTDAEGRKHLINDVTVSAKTPNFVKGWNFMVDHVNSFTSKTKEEVKELPDKIKSKKKTEESEESSSVSSEEVTDSSEEVSEVSSESPSEVSSESIEQSPESEEADSKE